MTIRTVSIPFSAPFSGGVRRQRAFVMMMVIGVLAVCSIFVITAASRAVALERFEKRWRDRQTQRQVARNSLQAFLGNGEAFMDVGNGAEELKMLVGVDDFIVHAVVTPLAEEDSRSALGVLDRDNLARRRLRISLSSASDDDSGAAPIFDELLTRSYMVLLEADRAPVLLLLDESFEEAGRANG